MGHKKFVKVNIFEAVLLGQRLYQSFFANELFFYEKLAETAFS